MTDLRKLAEGPDLLQLFADKLRIRKDQAEECECSFGDEDILAVAVEVLTECGCKPANASAAKDAEIARLQQLVYSPGRWHCPKCKFTLVQANLNAADGTVTARDTPGDKCPNCDSPLWRVSWKQDAIDNLDTAYRLVDEAKSKDAEIARLREALELAERAEKQHLNCKECGGEGLPECCAACWPSADAARLARWNALSKGQKLGNVIRLKEPSHG